MYPFNMWNYGRPATAAKVEPKHWCVNDGHKPVDNGTLRSWCSHCDQDMIFNRETGVYDAVAVPDTPIDCTDGD